MTCLTRPAALFASVLTLLHLAPSASAQTFTWAGTPSSYFWSAAANWTPAGGPPNAPGTVARFSTAASGTLLYVDGAFRVGAVSFDPDTGSLSQYVHEYLAGSQLILDNGAEPAIVQSLVNGSLRSFGYLNLPVTIAGNNALSVTNANPDTYSNYLTLYGSISGTASSVSVNGGGQPGLVVFSGANTYGGPGSVTTVGGGIFQAADGVGLPANTALVLNGAVLEHAYSNGMFTRNLGTGNGQVRVTGPAAGFSAHDGTLTVRLNGNAAPVMWGSPAFDPGVLILDAVSGLGGTVVFENGLDLNGVIRTIRTDGSNFTESEIGARISGAITSSSGPAGLTKAGPGTLELAGANTYTGPTTVTQGALRANDGQGLPTASNLLIDSGFLEGIGTTVFSRSIGAGPGQVRFGAGDGGFSASGGTLTVRLNGNTDPIAWGGPGFLSGSSTLRLLSPTANGLVDFQNGLDLAGGSHSVFADGNQMSQLDRARVSGVISNGSLVVFARDAPIELTGANAYTGSTYLAGSPVRATDGVGLPAASPLLLNGTFELFGPAAFTRSLGTGPGQVEISAFGGFSAFGGPVQVRLNNGTGTLTWGSTAFFGGGFGSFYLGSNHADDVTDFQNGIDFGGQTRTVVVGDNQSVLTDSTRLSGVLSNGGLFVNGLPRRTGLLELTAANSYTGPTTLSYVTLRANDGQGLPAASRLELDAGVLESRGPAVFTRSIGTGPGQVRFGGAGGGFSASGGTHTIRLNGNTDTVTLGSPNFFGLEFGSQFADALTDFQNGLDLNGRDVHLSVQDNPRVTTDRVRLSGVVSNGTLSKRNAGTLELTAANIYDGGTIIYEGRLLANNATGSGTGTGYAQGFGGTTLGGSGTIAPGPNKYVFVPEAVRLEPGGGDNNSLRIDLNPTGGSFAMFGTWSVRLLSAGTGGVAANSGGSSAGLPAEPTNHTFLDIAGNRPSSVHFDQITIYEVDGTGVVFEPGRGYSYRIGRVGAANELVGGPLNVTNQARFVPVGFEASDFSLTSDASGIIYLNFTPVPEPGLAFAAAAAGLGLFVRTRRRLRNGVSAR